MADVKLSATQQSLLDAMKAGVVVHYMPYGDRFNPKAYYFRNDMMKHCTAPAKALIDKGFAEKVDEFNNKRLVLKSKEAP